MRYETSAAFRRALEERLRQQSLTSAVPLARLRKMVAFERFLVRLVTAQPDAWVLKGGLALQFRLGERARTTQDIDLLLRQALPVAEIHQRLVNAALLDLGDWFLFEVARPSQPAGLRFGVQSRLDGRLFETFHVDVGVGDPLDPAGYTARTAASTFPGETFRVLKEKEIRQFGEYRTRRLVLEAWERLS